MLLSESLIRQTAEEMQSGSTSKAQVHYDAVPHALSPGLQRERQGKGPQGKASVVKAPLILPPHCCTASTWDQCSTVNASCALNISRVPAAAQERLGHQEDTGPTVI